ncbi:hypothetical protein cce_2730 [Crocosphaera subtropica ATCC 51142]|uniref:Uncharacterized protein n=1 Tax=Crocosphaera subtropica (strain ATCC 51142 / BH68) TaxID=43989 RepID=B1WU16_CROS5|nr:hypothetical protein cce_2730 [Crocosphaera subtropica ATCC 51142]
MVILKFGWLAVGVGSDRYSSCSNPVGRSPLL